jgi:hypothetical protein
MLDDFAVRYPGLRKSIDLWETGTNTPDLSPTSAIVFLLADPLKQLYPGCYQEAEELAQEARRRGIRVVNSPNALSNTMKSRQAQLLLAAGIPTARQIAFSSLETWREAVGVIAFPAMVRADLLHSQIRMIFCRSREEALAIPATRIPLPGSIAEFIDTAESFRAVAPNSEFAKYYHKKRAMVFGTHVVNTHIFFSLHPIVGSTSSTFGHYRSLNPVHRWLQNRRCRRHIEIDYDFFRREPENVELLRRTAAALDLEFSAIDYSSKADGSVVVWEANPHFSLYDWPFGLLPRHRRTQERHRHFHDAIQLFFRELQGGNP